MDTGRTFRAVLCGRSRQRFLRFLLCHVTWRSEEECECADIGTVLVQEGSILLVSQGCEMARTRPALVGEKGHDRRLIWSVGFVFTVLIPSVQRVVLCRSGF
jgi:hypothetical protein